MIATIVLVIALIAVYFLRILYWMRKTLPKYWNQYTPPHVNEDPTPKAEASDRSVEEIYVDSERNTVKWLVFGAGFFAAVIIFVIGLEEVLNRMGYMSTFEEHVIEGVSEGGVLSALTRLLGMLPLVGEVYDFAGELPGNSFIERFLLNGTAVFFAIAMRNWAYLFEHIDHVYAEASWGRPFRYLFYIPFYLVSTLFTSLLILLLVAVEFAFV
ncbi:hypothetical protein [Natrinema salinisoli]|uniref:hypothetical protein n=1 Tax=Natrinema salinisoli TaxID=2878535 RepID=UPI001CF032C7|nr:hypothetical protein [Natrinema salinisoli]